MLERAFERDLELRGFRQRSLKSTRRFALRARVLLLLNPQAFRSFLRHVRLGIQQRALQGLIQGLRVVIDPSCQDGAMCVGEVVLHEDRAAAVQLNSRERWAPTSLAWEENERTNRFPPFLSPFIIPFFFSSIRLSLLITSVL